MGRTNECYVHPLWGPILLSLCAALGRVETPPKGLATFAAIQLENLLRQCFADFCELCDASNCGLLHFLVSQRRQPSRVGTRAWTLEVSRADFQVDTDRKPDISDSWKRESEIFRSWVGRSSCNCSSTGLYVGDGLIPPRLP